MGVDSGPIPPAVFSSDMATKSGTLGDAVQTDSSDDAISRRVIDAVAETKGVDALDLDPLYDTIDPDALDVLFGDDASRSSTELRFEFEGCEVLIEGDGEVSITPPEGDLATIEAGSHSDQDASRGGIEDRCGIAIGVPGQMDTYHV